MDKMDSVLNTTLIDADRWKHLAGVAAVEPDPEEARLEQMQVARVEGHVWEITVAPTAATIHESILGAKTGETTIRLITPGREFSSFASTFADHRSGYYTLAALLEVKYIGSLKGRGVVIDALKTKESMIRVDCSEGADPCAPPLDDSKIPKLSDLRESCRKLSEEDQSDASETQAAAAAAP